MPLFYRITADVIVVLHMTYVLVILLGLLATWVGIVLRHRWPRNFWWRFIHLSMILIVVGEAWAGVICPLTVWEQQLRDLSGQETYSGGFIANLVHDWLFYDLPTWVFTAIYTAFGSLVLLSFIVAPPKWPGRRSLAVADAASHSGT